MLRLLAGCFLLGVFLCLSGVHWPLLQGMAWARMVVMYSAENGSWQEGFRQTVSGERPCGMCKRIAKALTDKRSPQELLRTSEVREKYYLISLSSLPWRTSQDFAYPREALSLWKSLRWAPPEPVPKSPVA